MRRPTRAALRLCSGGQRSCAECRGCPVQFKPPCCRSSGTAEWPSFWYAPPGRNDLVFPMRELKTRSANDQDFPDIIAREKKLQRGELAKQIFDMPVVEYPLQPEHGFAVAFAG